MAAAHGVWWSTGDIWRKTDADGTEWRIRHTVAETSVEAEGHVVLVMEYRDIRLTATHPSVDAAKSHAADMRRMWEARSLRDYAAGH